MPAIDLAARRYAEAVFELAVEAGNLDEWEQALTRIADFMTGQEVRYVLENTRVPEESKQRLVAAGLSDLPALPFNMARLLVHKGRTGLARGIEEAFKELAEEKEGIARARAVTAVPLSEAERQALTQRLERDTGRRIILETAVDPELLGGVRVQIGDQLIDASTRARLEALRENLVGAM